METNNGQEFYFKVNPNGSVSLNFEKPLFVFDFTYSKEDNRHHVKIKEKRTGNTEHRVANPNEEMLELVDEFSLNLQERGAITQIQFYAS